MKRKSIGDLGDRRNERRQIEMRENIVAAFGIVPILPALRIRCVGKVDAGLCGFFVARITRSGGF